MVAGSGMLLTGGVVAAGVLGGSPGPGDGATVHLSGLRPASLPPRAGEARPRGAPARVVPPPARIRKARRYAAGRDGLVSFALVDSRGRLHALDGDRPYVSASVVKVMLLAAELRRLHGEGLPLDPLTRDLLTRMITYSDNAAADAIYARNGDEGLYEAARVGGMRSFRVAGYWANAQITASAMARAMWRLDALMAGSQHDFAIGLLGRIVPEQSWGIPAAARDRWDVRFKGGWRGTELGQLVHQAARLQRGPDHLSLAVLTDAQPSQEYGQATVRGVASRLLSRRGPRRPESAPQGS